jgi:hypothetical protein
LRVLTLLLFCFALLASFESEARKFSFATEDMAAFVRGTGGMSAVKQDAFAEASPATTTMSSEQSQLNYGVELGFLFRIHETLNLRLGAEILQAKISGVKGTNASVAEQFTLESDIFAFNPMAHLEFSWANQPTSRFVGTLGLGLASVRLDNSYAMTTTGTAELGQDTFTEKSEGEFVNGVISVGWEGLLVDNTTVLLDVGYRFFDVNKLKSTADNPRLGGGTSAKGSELTNADGSKRSFDLGGPFIGLSFRFYIDII